MSVLKKLQKRKLLLDTHVLIWLMTGDKSLSNTFKSAIDRCAKLENILISTISIWEIGMLVEKKRITLEMDRLEWIEEALNSPGIQEAPITPRIAMQSTRLPGKLHSDPADQILVATAREHSAVLVTHDAKILNYGNGRFINVFDPT